MKPNFLNNLQLKVTVAFLLVALVPLGSVSIFSVRTANNVIESIVQDQLENVAAEKQALLERWIVERKADLEVLAGSSAVLEKDPAEVGPYFELVRREYGVYTRFIIASREAKVVYDSEGVAGASCAGELWYQRAISGRPYMSEIELTAAGEQSVFRLSTPIRGEKDEAQGVLCAVVNTDAIVEGVLHIEELGKTGECYLVDNRGTFLAHQDPKRVLNESIAQSHSFTHIFDSTKGQPIYEDYRGIQVLGASSSLKGPDWHVVVEQDRDEAFGPSDRLQRNIWIVIGATVLVAGGISTALAWYVASPIRALSETARTLSRGDFDTALVDARTTRRDEIGALYAAFEEMAGRLKDRHCSLETRMGLTEAELQRVEAELKGTLEAAARSERLAALGRLAAGVAHEIRTPLTSLKLFLQSVYEDIAVSFEQNEDYRIAMRQVARIERTISHFLDFARPQEPVFSEIDFGHLVDEVLEVIRPRASQQEVEIHTCVAAELPKVEGDVRQLGEVLVNLLVNALDAMADGGRLTISVSSETAEAGSTDPARVRIDVSDTGPGIPENDIERMFEPFFTTKATGSGLGLAIIKGTLERHSGTISVSTRLEHGTTFSVRLPVAPA